MPDLMSPLESVRQILRRHFAKVAEGVVEIVSAARTPGSRCLLIVRSCDPRVDAVASCTRRGAGSRDAMKPVMADLKVKHLGVLLWQPSTEGLIKNAFSPHEVVLDSAFRRAWVTLRLLESGQFRHLTPEEEWSGASETADLMSQITGWQIKLAGSAPSRG